VLAQVEATPSDDIPIRTSVSASFRMRATLSENMSLPTYLALTSRLLKRTLGVSWFLWDLSFLRSPEKSQWRGRPVLRGTALFRRDQHLRLVPGGSLL